MKNDISAYICVCMRLYNKNRNTEYRAEKKRACLHNNFLKKEEDNECLIPTPKTLSHS